MVRNDAQLFKKETLNILETGEIYVEGYMIITCRQFYIIFLRSIYRKALRQIIIHVSLSKFIKQCIF